MKSKIFVIVATSLLSLSALAATGAACCKPGSACCTPGASCCPSHHTGASHCDCGNGK